MVPLSAKVLSSGKRQTLLPILFVLKTYLHYLPTKFVYPKQESKTIIIVSYFHHSFSLCYSTWTFSYYAYFTGFHFSLLKTFALFQFCSIFPFLLLTTFIWQIVLQSIFVNLSSFCMRVLCQLEFNHQFLSFSI